MYFYSPGFIRSIVLYKAVKSVAELLCAGLIGCLLWLGLGGGLEAWLSALQEHLVSAGSLQLAASAIAESLEEHARLMLLVLAADGAFGLAEGWVLWRRYPWGEWVVVFSSGVFLPFEMAALLNGVHAGRVLLAAANLAITGGLAWRVCRRTKRTATG
jgi:uncharacterized membrane protein (DUF2068 family)